MSTENYLTLYKELPLQYTDRNITGTAKYSKDNEITYIITDEEAEIVIDQINNDCKYSFINVKESFKGNKKVIKRAIDLRKFKSLNKVDKIDNLIRFKRLIPLKENGIIDNFLQFLKDIDVADEEESIYSIKKLFNFSIEIIGAAGKTSTTYTNCKIIEHSTEVDNVCTLENVYLIFDDIIQNIGVINPSNLPVKGRRILTSDCVTPLINDIALGLTQELEVEDLLVKA